MQKLIALKIALIIATVSGSSFAMPYRTPTIHCVLSTDEGPGFVSAEILDPECKNTLRVASPEIKRLIDLMIRDIVIHELNEASLVHVTDVATILRSIKINLINTDFINQNTIFPEFPLLKTLNLSRTNPTPYVPRTKASAQQMSAIIQTIIEQCPKLEELDISDCYDAPDGIMLALNENPHALQHLKKLNLSRTNTSAKQINTIMQSCLKLEDLTIADYELDIADREKAPAAGIMQALTENSLALQRLKKLNLSRTSPSAKQISAIVQNCPQLEELNLFSSYEKAPAGIIQALATNPEALQCLKKLNLCETNSSTEQTCTIIQHCPQLEELNLKGSFRAPAGIIKALTEKPHALQCLKKLNLGSIYCSIELMSAIIQQCPQLKELCLPSCSNGPATLAANPYVLQRLKKIDLSGTDTSDELMSTIIQNCQNLEELDLSFFNGPIASIIQALIANPLALQNLKKLYLYYAGSLDEQIDFIQQGIPGIKIYR